MRAGGRILMIFGLILAVIAGVATFLVLQGSDADPNAATSPTTDNVRVVVAFQPIEPWQEIPVDAIGVRDYPQPAPDNAVLEDQPTVDEVTGEETVVPGAQFVAGKISNTRIYPGQVIVASQLVDKQLEEERLGLGGTAAYIVPDGQYAVTIPVNQASLIAGALRAGDQVDIIASLNIENLADPESAPEPVSQILLQRVQILRVGFWGAQPQDDGGVGEVSQTYVTVIVTPQQAVELKTIKEQTNFEFGLRSITDEADFVTEPVDLDYIIEQYNVRP